MLLFNSLKATLFVAFSSYWKEPSGLPENSRNQLLLNVGNIFLFLGLSCLLLLGMVDNKATLRFLLFYLGVAVNRPLFPSLSGNFPDLIL